MKYYLKFIKIYLNVIGSIAPKIAAKKAFNIFQKVRLKSPKKRELPFYEDAKAFNVPVANDTLHAYQLGNPNGKLVILVHGWDSNAGSLTLFARALAAKDYKVIAFDLLAHHKSQKKHTNLYDSNNAIIDLLKHLAPTAPFDIIGHSFGASALTYALSETDYKVNKIVFLSSNDRIIEVLRDFQRFLGFNERVFQQVKLYIDAVIHEDFAEMRTSTKLKKVSFNELLIIHDKVDKIIPFHNARQIHEAIPNSKLIAFERIGHYRMLWNKEVVKETVDFIVS